MRLIAFSALRGYAASHPETMPSLNRWRAVVKAARWTSMSEVQSAFSRVVVLNAERVRFEVAGGNYRLIVAIDFEKQIVFVKFLGTHKEYDVVDALTVAKF